MRLTSLEQKIADIVTPVLNEMEIDLLWVTYKGGILSLYAENPKTNKLTLDECTQISREVSPLLEVEDPINAKYRLEVSSPGIDRPLLKLEDYKRFHNLEAKIEIDELIEGQKKFRGVIKNSTDKIITLDTDHGEVDLPFASIYKAKLVMTDTLIKETKKRFENTKNNLSEETKRTTN